MRPKTYRPQWLLLAGGPLLAAIVAAGLIGGGVLASGRGDQDTTIPIADTIPPGGVRDWDLDLTTDYEYGLYRLARFPNEPAKADATAWHNRFGAWRHEESGDDPQSSLRVIPQSIPAGYLPTDFFSVRSVGPSGTVAYQRWQVDFKVADQEAPPITLYRFGYAAERWPNGIGVHATPMGGMLQISLTYLDGVPVVIEHPSPVTDRYPFQRYRWVQNNIETVLEATALRHEDLFRIVSEIIAHDKRAGSQS